MLSYTLNFPRQIVFGAGRRHEIGRYAPSIGRRALLICGSRTLEQRGEVQVLIDHLRQSGIFLLGVEIVSREPETEDVDRLVARFHETTIDGDFVVALGGGAAIDLGKAVAGLLPQPPTENGTIAPIRDYLEGVGCGRQLVADPLPLIALPTTAGTGSEATKNAVISSETPPFKKSLRDDRMMPSLALVDPELTQSCSSKVTAESGMDAVTQLFESYVTKKRQPLIDTLIEQGLSHALKALPLLMDRPDHLEARIQMSHAALISGIALANTGLGMAHGIAPALGIHGRIPHGAACALLLPATLKTNADCCAERYARLARLVLPIDSRMSDEKAIELLIGHVEELCDRLGVSRRLSDFGVDATRIPEIVRDSQGNSMSGNPKELPENDLKEILVELV